MRASGLTYQQRKAAAQFRALDLDGNGYLERDDYNAMVDRLLVAFRVAADSPTAMNLRHQYLRLFDKLVERMDTDGDGRVSEAEFLESVGRSVAKSRGKAMRAVAHAVFTTADTDHDDHLSATEFDDLLHVMGAPMDRDAVARAVDSDGRLDRESWARIIDDYYGSGDPQAPGSRLFGSIVA
ncbi:EF-hand domain-containing protein [Nocardia iowensis]|uniref:EF-hand domain-containing protein n=1 Tax=Nocardia iowensis TaxID=204891 RepID=A0ABX8RQZ6_NOCIO|nr:EF-hand domain-containing protein [Nocardia iowensis]QXN90740.1 EF-hand domain-containing protein [Nocardia iowensis]